MLFSLVFIFTNYSIANSFSNVFVSNTELKSSCITLLSCSHRIVVFTMKILIREKRDYAQRSSKKKTSDTIIVMGGKIIIKSIQKVLNSGFIFFSFLYFARIW